MWLTFKILQTHKKATSEADKKHLEEIEKKLESIKELEAEVSAVWKNVWRTKNIVFQTIKQ